MRCLPNSADLTPCGRDSGPAACHCQCHPSGDRGTVCAGSQASRQRTRQKGQKPRICWDLSPISDHLRSIKWWSRGQFNGAHRVRKQGSSPSYESQLPPKLPPAAQGSTLQLNRAALSNESITPRGGAILCRSRRRVCPSMPETVQRETGMRLIRERDRRIKTGVPRSTWYVLMSAGLAPTPVKLGLRSVAWIEDELEAWMHGLEAKRKGRPGLTEP